MGNQDTKSEEDCVMVPVDCQINSNTNGFQKRKFSEIQKDDQKQKKSWVEGGKGIKHLSGRKFKQKSTQIKGDNVDTSIESRNFDMKMSKAQKLFKSLHVVKRFQSKYNKEYPVMILNKSQSMRNLRQEISREKQNHKYFISEEQLSSSFKPKQKVDTYNNKSQKKSKLLNQLIHHHFTVIQQLEWLFIRISQTGRHQNVLKIIKQMDNEYSLNESKDKLQEIKCFVKYIDALNIELMDMLYYQLHNSKEQTFQHHNNDNKQFIQDKKQQINAPKVINVKEAIMKERLLSQREKQCIVSYESCKEKGWEIYKANKVCFYILAMENQTFIPELQALEIPQNLTILEIILEKYDAFAQMIQVSELSICILIDEKRKSRFHKLMQQSQHKWKRLNIRILLSEQLPVLDIEGNFMFELENEDIYMVRKASIGSGDVWNCLRDDFDEVQKFEYVQVIGVRNCLQSGFDCFLLAKSKEVGFGWATKVFESIERLTELRFMKEGKQSKNLNFSLPQEPIISSSLPHYMIHPREIDYSNQLNSIIQSSKPFYAYGKHTLLSTRFIKRVIQNMGKMQQRMYRKKIISEGNQKFIVFERDFIDDSILTSLNKEGQEFGKWGLFVCEREGSYYPLYRQENGGVFDVQGCSRTLSLNYLSKLNLSVNRFLSLTGSQSISCYIDPHVSLQGEGLDDISLEIERRINSLLVEQNNQLNQRIASIQMKQSSPLKHKMKTPQGLSPSDFSQVQEFPTTASRVVSSISQIAILQQQKQNQQQQQIAIFIN